jgi:ligand-binding SRPBCC domain-containing protein
MKRLVLRTAVDGDMEQVFAGFDRSLFEFLLPPGAKLIRFDGSDTGDLVQLRLPIAGEWISRITASYRDDQQAYFIDEGVKLPIGLRDWTHKHTVYRGAHGSVIEDDIAFSSGNPVLDWLLYPVMYMAFAPRRNRYRAYFAKARRAAG